MLLACWHSLGQLTGRNWAILSDFYVSIFFWQDRPKQQEGVTRIRESKRRQDAAPAGPFIENVKSENPLPVPAAYPLEVTRNPEPKMKATKTASEERKV